ncbi:MAG TPA: response regulator [Puia sp.]|jgi:CheY-like chemotaxis protein|nr:response regulator [Puia sp.]
MKKNYILLVVGCLFFLTLTFFSIWWIVLALVFGLGCIVYRIHRNLLNKVEAHKSDLEQELAEKLAQLEKGLRNEKNMRRKIDEIQQSKTVVLNKISHDIRTPMNSMMGMASLLGQTSLNTEQNGYLDTIRNCGREMMTAINDILLKDMLNYSVAGTEKTTHDQTEFGLRNCIEDVLNSFSAKAEKEGIELLCNVGYDIPEQVAGDESRLRQVLLNLIENAIRNTSSGEIIVVVTAKQAMKKEEIVLVFEVKDTGKGMTADKVSKILASFSRPDDSDALHVENIGLGLIISNRLITIMGGKLLIRSKTNEGTSALFEIVVRDAVAVQKRNTPDNSAGLLGKKILLVVNNAANGNILMGQLESWKLSPILAKSEKQALEILSADTVFDLIITDLNLSDSNGIQLAKKVQELFPGLPAILMNCANDEQHQQHQGLFKSILSRPVKLEVLHNQILSALNALDQNILKQHNGSFQLSDKFSEHYPLRILIAEDDLMNQQLAVKILSRLGYKSEVAKNGKEVLEIVSLERFDLILMDVEMPDMDGLEATRMIRLCLEAQPVIIAMTANAMQGDREICLKSGMDDYISKPVELEELVRMLEKWALAGKEKL